ncbi:MAG TPA: MoaD/ThiS family protein [Candidatus Acidoferrales bacterium]|nr:MoaD/ThiS family protein [Candidatus Acidoferrales bacterium]
MASVHFWLPPILAPFAGGEREFQVEAETLAGALEEARSRHPLLKTHVWDEDGLQRQHVLLFWNQRDVRHLESLEVPVREGDEVVLIQAMSGGARKVAPRERIRVRVRPREGVRSKELLRAIRDRAVESGPWTVRSRRPLVLEHSGHRGRGLQYKLDDDGDEVLLSIEGGGARLGLGYATTLLAGDRLGGSISSFEVKLPPR